jgi:MFS family permease
LIRFRDVLKNRSFLFLWLGQIISNFGDRLNLMALFALVSRRAPGSTIGFAKLFFFMVIPVFVVGPIAGVYVDRWDRKRVMIISDILRGILVLLIPFFILSFNSFIPIYILVFLLYSITRFFLPSKMAVIPDIVPRDMLLLANTLSDTTKMVAAVVAFGIAGILVDKIGAINAFYIDAVTFFISALFISNMVVKKIISHFREDILRAREAIKSAIRRTVWSDIREGVKFIIEHKEMKFVVKNFFVLMAGIGSISCVIIVFIQEAFGSVTKDFSLLLMFVVLGTLIGAVCYGRFGSRLKKEYVILTCILFAGLLITLFAVVTKLYPSFWLSAAAMLTFGVSLGPITVSIYTTIHEFIPQETRGRIFSSLEAVIHLGFLVCMFIAALLAEHVDRIWIIIVCGVVFSLWGALGIFGMRKK